MDKENYPNEIMKIFVTIFILFSFNPIFGQCDSTYTHYTELPSNVTILVGDSCLYNDDISVLDSIISLNELNYESPLDLGTQTWFNGRLRFLVAGNYGNSSGVNDTIYTLPNNIGNWSELSSLYLEWNRISELPESFSGLSNLQSFYINNNILGSLPDSFGNLENLYFLDLGYNEIEEIPESICELSGLTYLWLFNNNLETLPECFCDLPLDWNNDDNGGYPYFAIGANMLCDSIDSCVAESEHFELSLDQFYYSFPVYAPQDCDNVSIQANILPSQFYVSQPYPNPFNPKTNFKLNIAVDQRMSIAIYNLLGNEVDVISKNKLFRTGSYQFTWDGTNFPSGIYIIKINDGITIELRKMILMK